MSPDALQSMFAEARAAGTWTIPLASLIASFVAGQALAWAYERTYVGLSYSRGFSHTLVLVAIAASILVLAMSRSIVAGIGLFGVLSMIRFRTDLKTSRDLVFVMAAAAIGVATGVGAWTVALLGTAILCLVALYLAASPFGSRTRYDGVLRFRIVPSVKSQLTLRKILGDYCRRSVLLSTSELDAGNVCEHVYQVKFFRAADHGALLAALRDEIHARESRLMLQDSTSEY